MIQGNMRQTNIITIILLSATLGLVSCSKGAGDNSGGGSTIPAIPVVPPIPGPNSAPAANLGDVSVGCGTFTCNVMALQWVIPAGQTIDSLDYNIYDQSGNSIQKGTIQAGNNTNGFIIDPQNSSVLLGSKNGTYYVDLTTHLKDFQDNTTKGIVIQNPGS